MKLGNSKRTVINMCAKIEELNGLSAEDILGKYWKRNILPIDISKILFNLKVRFVPFNFSQLEKSNNIDSGDILGVVLANNNDLAILYKEAETLNRTRFTLAHELAHCCLKHILPNDKQHIEFRSKSAVQDKKEIDANIFAGELLIPEKELRLSLVKFFENTFPSSVLLAQIFSVSINVMEERLRYLKIPFIDSNKIKTLYIE